MVKWLTKKHESGVTNLDYICFLLLLIVLFIGLYLKGKYFKELYETDANSVDITYDYIEEEDDYEFEYNKTDTPIQTDLLDTIEEDIEEELVYITEDVELLARLAMSEGSILSYIEKKAIVEVVLNRVDDDNYPNTIREVIYQPNQFSLGDNGTPTTECYQAVYDALEYRSFPTDMLWFRQDYADYGCEYLHMKDSNMVFSTINKY